MDRDLLFRGARLIIPVSLQQEILPRLHETYQGIVKTKQQTREQVFWPDMNKDI
ncbi:hypothetical protein CAPTEDRAFT_137531 [Capitella teleta]|uniref:Integrase zinc-binding domain-containing protein n=1 Tax=Capitella teleta TaxID=283909 RepID=R7T919_CAPTE|nr:hypothetical protein CAPTEDRAFT_137531 [Capitella teleta]|eukprot:ELT90228.1 hypothetical protein CAPTEDRAFT_137531 [Capitella teleta]